MRPPPGRPDDVAKVMDEKLIRLREGRPMRAACWDMVITSLHWK